MLAFAIHKPHVNLNKKLAFLSLFFTTTWALNSCFKPPLVLIPTPLPQLPSSNKQQYRTFKRLSPVFCSSKPNSKFLTVLCLLKLMASLFLPSCCPSLWFGPPEVKEIKVGDFKGEMHPGIACSSKMGGWNGGTKALAGNSNLHNGTSLKLSKVRGDKRNHRAESGIGNHYAMSLFVIYQGAVKYQLRLWPRNQVIQKGYGLPWARLPNSFDLSAEWSACKLQVSGHQQEILAGDPPGQALAEELGAPIALEGKDAGESNGQRKIQMNISRMQIEVMPRRVDLGNRVYGESAKRMSAEELEEGKPVFERYFISHKGKDSSAFYSGCEDDALPNIKMGSWPCKSSAVLRHGVRGLVIDPYYRSSIINALLTLGSAHFVNKCDNGIVIHRNRNPNAGPIEQVQKIVLSTWAIAGKLFARSIKILESPKPQVGQSFENGFFNAKNIAGLQGSKTLGKENPSTAPMAVAPDNLVLEGDLKVETMTVED
ncbi:hypothetical protein NC653_004871 [Populus alba x Populus x berolinensis]|uniref:Uncharacterized protein n=1 Tax=Populus alba x Populus x berolinensis TaxID=444605 RepID=A0AAD6RV22_9ROSI|nr:hypothetical protein NC653_004871 [Populus alba x Populus x berolinensis]